MLFPAWHCSPCLPSTLPSGGKWDTGKAGWELTGHPRLDLGSQLPCLCPLCPLRFIKSERSIILLNFCLSILASNILILVGQSRVLSKAGAGSRGIRE